MENNDYNLELAKYIWSILKTQITILMSWGFEPKSMKVIDGGLEFGCNGFKHTGKVQIVLDEGKDLFEVHLISENGEKVKTIEDVFLDRLISVVDENIEKRKTIKNGFLKHIILWSFRESKGKRILGKVGISEKPKFLRIFCFNSCLNGY